MNSTKLILVFLLLVVITPIIEGQLKVDAIQFYKNYLNRGCPILDCHALQISSRCRMATLYYYNGKRCRGCYRNICETSPLQSRNNSVDLN